MLYNNKKEKYKKATSTSHLFETQLSPITYINMNAEDLEAYQHHCFEYSQDFDLFESILTDQAQMPELKTQHILSCNSKPEQLL